MNMKHIGTFPALTLCILTGCAQMGTRQLDRNETTRYDIDKKGQTNAITTEVRTTSTRASGRAVLSGKNTFEGLDASQNGKAQGLKVKKSAQQTDGLTQAVETLKLLRDLGGMAYGMPPMQSVQQPMQPVMIAPQPVQPAALPAPPAGKKWILAPKDDPSEPQPEQ